MKKNVYRIGYDGSPMEHGIWWVWEEICDRCGVQIFDESVHHSCFEENEVDFCPECLKYFMDNNITYDQAIVLYRRN